MEERGVVEIEIVKDVGNKGKFLDDVVTRDEHSLLSILLRIKSNILR